MAKAKSVQKSNNKKSASVKKTALPKAKAQAKAASAKAKAKAEALAKGGQAKVRNQADRRSSDGKVTRAIDSELDAYPDVVVAGARNEQGESVRDARFYRFIDRGGYWTAEHLYVGSNECGGVASNGFPKMWSQLFQYAQHYVFSYAMYGGQANATMLGREFVRRSEFFINAYVEADDQTSFRYTQAICDLYEEHQEFRDWMLALPITSAAFARGHALRHEFPLEPIDAVDTE